jgi:transposase
VERDQQLVMTVEEAGARVGLSRASAYRAVHRWRETGGAEGIPVVVLSGRRYVVPIAAFDQLLATAAPISAN